MRMPRRWTKRSLQIASPGRAAARLRCATLTPDASDRVGNRDADIVASRDHRIGRHRLASIADATPHINDEPVQRALHLGAVELPLAEGAASVRAAVVDGGTAIADAEQRDLEAIVCRNDRAAAFGDLRKLDGELGHVHAYPWPSSNASRLPGAAILRTAVIHGPSSSRQAIWAPK